MERLVIRKWGNSRGLRLPKHLSDFLHVDVGDEVSVSPREVLDRRQLIVEPINSVEEFTIEELFADYHVNQKEHVTLQDLGQPQGNEEW